MDVLELAPVTRHRLTVDQYYRMAETGVLAPDARVELIEGDVIDMAPMGSRHYAAVSRLNRLLVQATSDHAMIAVQSPLRLGPYSEPEPDVAVLRPRGDFYGSGLPTAQDALLVIEVADSTAAYDLRLKSRLYARHGVPVYWVVEVGAGVLHTFTLPVGDAYTVVHTTTEPGMVAVPGLDGISIDLSQLLGT